MGQRTVWQALLRQNTTCICPPEMHAHVYEGHVQERHGSATHSNSKYPTWPSTVKTTDPAVFPPQKKLVMKRGTRSCQQHEGVSQNTILNKRRSASWVVPFTNSSKTGTNGSVGLESRLVVVLGRGRGWGLELGTGYSWRVGHLLFFALGAVHSEFSL